MSQREQNRFNQLVVKMLGEANRRIDDCFANISVSGGSSGLSQIALGGRLTPSAGIPVIASNVTGATSIYYTPYINNIITLWDGSKWTPTIFSETQLVIGAGSLTAGKGYDVFGYLNAGVFAMESLAWASGVARATAITLQDGRYCKSGDKTRLYLGSFYARTTSGYNCEFYVGSSDGGKWDLWNMYNRKPVPLYVLDTTNSWAYNTDTIRQARGAAGNKVEFFLGLQEDEVSASVGICVFVSGNNLLASKAGCGLDTTTAFTGQVGAGYNSTVDYFYFEITGSFRTNPTIGYHYISWNEKGGDGSVTWLGDNGGDGQQAGMHATVWA